VSRIHLTDPARSTLILCLAMVPILVFAIVSALVF
jgi:hypothetical protein